SLNPTLSLGTQVAEVLVRHRGLTRQQAWKEGEAMLDRVGLKTPAAKGLDLGIGLFEQVLAAKQYAAAGFAGVLGQI
ncbi:hypothetical protein ACC702_40145, partial [Rhizobium ruizarguesonis]